ncbi:Hsp70 family protein, partial [Streptomyces barkulensis]
AETRNQAEQLVYTTEKFLTDNADKVPGDVKSEVEASVADLKEKLKGDSAEGDNTAAIREASEKVAATSQKLGQALYADAQGRQAAGGAEAGAGARAGGADEDVVDAEILDEDRDDRGRAA